MALNKDRIQKAVDKHLSKQRYERAIAEWEAWLKENPKDWNTIRVVGDLYARAGRNDEAIKKYAAVADHYRRDGFNVRAIATHKMVLRLDPQNESAMRNLAELSAEEGLLMEAKSYYQQILELYSKGGHKNAAADVFRKLAAIDPQDLKIRYKFAEFLAKQGKSDEAAAEYVGIADQFIGQGLVEEAIKILQQGSSVATREPSLKLKLAHAYSVSGKHAEAVSMLEKVRDANPTDSKVLSELGDAYMAAGRTAEAESAFQALAQQDPTNTDVALRLVDVRVVQSQMDPALELLVPFLDRAVADGEGAKAAALLQKILAKDPYHIGSLLKLAEIHTVSKNESARVSAYDSLCEAYSRIGDYEKAVQVVEQLVELDPETSQHGDRLKFLQSKLAHAKPAQRGTGGDEIPDLDLEEITLEEESPDTAKGLRVEDLPRKQEPAPQVDLGDVVELTEEDEENIKEKLTEAEVFVRYGLVDKAIAQLVDVLESFRFHAESREKLIEIYKDQGMSSEAAEQLMQLAQVRDKLGQPEAADAAREEAAELSPALASKVAAAEMGPEVELTPVPGSDTDFRFDEGPEMGVEIDEEASDSAASPAITADDLDGDEIPIVLEEGTGGPGALLEDESEIEVPMADEVDVDIAGLEEDAGPDLGRGSDAAEFAVDLGDDEDESAEVAISIDQSTADDLEGLSEIVPSDGPSELGFDADDDDEDDIAIDLDAGEDVPFAIDGGDENDSVAGSMVASDPGEQAPAPLDLANGSDEGLDSDGGDIVIDLDGDVPVEPMEPMEQEPSVQSDVLDPESSHPSVDEVSLPGIDGDSALSDSIDLGVEQDALSVEVNDEEDDIAVDFPSDMAGLEVNDAQEDEVLSPNLEVASPDEAPEIEIDIPVASTEPLSGAELSTDAVGSIPAESDTTDDVEPVDSAPVQLSQADSGVAEPSPFSGGGGPTLESPEPELVTDPLGTSDASPFSDELDEVDQYIALGLYEDARDSLRDLLRQQPSEPSVLAKIEELGFSREQLQKEATPGALAGEPAAVPADVAAPPPTVPPSSPVLDEPPGAPIELTAPLANTDESPGPSEVPMSAQFTDNGSLESLVDRPSSSESMGGVSEESFIDLASELSDDLFGTQSAVAEENEEPEGPLTDPGLDQIFREFRKGVEKQLDTEDYDTRYNLGIAYKEMGLLDEAIAEFQLAAKDAVRGLECCSMLGLCFMEKGMPDIAIKWFAKGLDLPGRRDEEYHGLRYDLAQAYEAAGQSDRALSLYMDIFKDNAGFRDVKDRVRELQAARK